MPSYSYLCSCGVLFEAHVQVSKHKDPQKCPACGEKAPRQMPETLTGHFNKDVSGPVPQNTGIQDLDNHIDRVIGKSAAQGMAVIEKRQAEKRAFIREQGLENGKRVARCPDGSLDVNSPDEQAFAERANRINSRAMQTLRPKAKH